MAISANVPPVAGSNDPQPANGPLRPEVNLLLGAMNHQADMMVDLYQLHDLLVDLNSRQMVTHVMAANQRVHETLQFLLKILMHDSTTP